MTRPGRLFRFISYLALPATCTIVVGSMFWLFLLDSGAAALLALIGGSVVWGLAAGALRTPGLALPAMALVVELVVAFEFKRIYVLDYVGGRPARSVGVFMHSTSISDLLIAVALAGFGWLGWRWARRRIIAGA